MECEISHRKTKTEKIQMSKVVRKRPPHTKRCVDCLKLISDRATRCRRCVCRILGRKAEGNKPYGDVAMTDAEIAKRYRDRKRGKFVADCNWPFPKPLRTIHDE